MDNKIKETVNNIIANSDIVEVINNFITLSKKGRNYVCLCPFHDDRNPSMNIDTKKQIFKCFVCGTGGNVAQFLVKYKHWSFWETIKYLADRLNINFDYQSMSDYKSHQRSEEELKILASLNKANSLYKLELIKCKNDPKVSEFINKRHLNAETIQAFDIGYASAEQFKILFKEELEKEPEILAKASLINPKTLECAFHDRITFAIKNENDEVVGFSARTLEKDVKPKYVNSAENEFFKKSSILYNYQRINKLNDTKTIIITEGFFDVIALYKVGIENATCLMGTALTAQHLPLLKNKEIIIFLDGDDPGQNASLKSAKFLMEYGFDIKIVRNKTQYDPDEILNNLGAGVLKKMLEDAPIALDFVYEYYTKKYSLMFSSNNEIKRLLEFEKDFLEYLQYYPQNIQDFYKTRILNDYKYEIKTRIANIKNISSYSYEDSYVPTPPDEYHSGTYSIINNYVDDYDYNQYQDLVNNTNNYQINNNTFNRNKQGPFLAKQNISNQIDWVDKLFFTILYHPDLASFYKNENKKEPLMLQVFDNSDQKNEIYDCIIKNKPDSALWNNLKQKYNDLWINQGGGIILKNFELNLNENNKKKKFDELFSRARHESDNKYIEYASREDITKQISENEKMFKDHENKIRRITERKNNNGSN